jgi:LPS-assembly lipoprotein
MKIVRSFQSIFVVGILALGMQACFKPLYGSAEFGGLNVQQGLAGVTIDVQGERLAHYLRNELEYSLRGGNPNSVPTTHRLVVVAKQSLSTAIVDRVVGVAESATLVIDAKYALYPKDKTLASTEGEAKVLVTYDRSQQRFASVRAARDAEIQGTKQLAEQIKVRIASYLANNR